MRKLHQTILYTALFIFVIVLTSCTPREELVLPTLAVLPTQPTVATATPIAPTPSPTLGVIESQPVSSPTVQPIANNGMLADPVPEQMVVQFAPDTTQEDRAAYIAPLGGEVTESINALNTVVISVPQPIAAQPLPTSPVVVANEPDYYVTALIDLPTSDPYYSQ